MYGEIYRRIHNYKSFEIATSIIVLILLFICVFTFSFERSDTTPAAPQYQKALVDRINGITTNPKKLLRDNGSIEVHNGITTYSIENSECRATAKYDEAYNVLEIEVKDKSISVLLAIGLSLLLSAIVSTLGFFIFLIFIFLLSILYMALFGDYRYL